MPAAHVSYSKCAACQGTSSCTQFDICALVVDNGHKASPAGWGIEAGPVRSARVRPLTRALRAPGPVRVPNEASLCCTDAVAVRGRPTRGRAFGACGRSSTPSPSGCRRSWICPARNCSACHCEPHSLRSVQAPRSNLQRGRDAHGWRLLRYAVEKLPVCHCEEAAAAADEAISTSDMEIASLRLAMTAVVSVLAHAARRHGILAMTG